MPYTTEWVDPEVFLEHKGVKVYCTYKDDDMMQGPYSYLFSLNDLCGDESCGCDGGMCMYVFDVQELPTWREPSHPPYLTGMDDTPENKVAWDKYHAECVKENAAKRAIKEALDLGLLVPPAAEAKSQPFSQSVRPTPLVGMNLKRAQWARQAVVAFMAATGLSEADGFDTAISDLLVDLTHLTFELNLDFQELMARAERHYTAETASLCSACRRAHDAEADGAEDALCIECDREQEGA